jgi:hypothetical protein
MPVNEAAFYKSAPGRRRELKNPSEIIGNPTRRMKPLRTNDVKIATVAVLAHGLIALLHGVAHASQVIRLSGVANAFVLLVIGIGPFAGLWLIRTGQPRRGGLTLTFTMAASLIFGLWNHFLVAGSDHVAHLQDGFSKPIFQVTAVLLVVTECVGTMSGLRLFRNWRLQPHQA